MNKIGVLGCGWLGYPLAKSLILKGYIVKGTSTTNAKVTSLKKDLIKGYFLKLQSNEIQGDLLDFLKDLDVLVLNIPPRLRRNPTENYVQKIKNLIDPIKEVHIKKLLFVSSTSVYGLASGIINEDSIAKPYTESGKQLLEVETLLQKESSFATTIIRFGGLIGKERHPINQLSGKKNLTNGNDSVNLIHLDDCIALIEWIIKKEKWGTTFNGVYPYHPTKKAYYTEIAKKRGLAPPTYEDNLVSEGKIIRTKYSYLNNHIIKTPIA